MLKNGVLTYSLASSLPSSSLVRCQAAWQQCQPNQNLSASLTRHKLWPTLEYCLRTNQLWDYVPLSLQKQLSRNRQECAIRQLQIISQLEELDAALTEAGKEVILLKGAALVFYPIYPSLGERGTADIDILVNSDDIPVVVQILQNLGYVGGLDDNRPHHHLPPFCKEQAVPIEVHFTIPSGKMQQPISELLAISAQPIAELPSLRLPSVTELFWHMAWHAYFAVPQLRNLLDLYRLQQLYDVDTQLLEQRAFSEKKSKIWSTLMQHLQELEHGRFNLQTIMAWEWIPTKNHDTYYACTLAYRGKADPWQDMFKLGYRRMPGVPAVIVQLSVITWWLVHSGLVASEWLFSYLRLSSEQRL